MDLDQATKFFVGRERPFVNALSASQKGQTLRPDDNDLSSSRATRRGPSRSPPPQAHARRCAATAGRPSPGSPAGRWPSQRIPAHRRRQALGDGRGHRDDGGHGGREIGVPFAFHRPASPRGGVRGRRSGWRRCRTAWRFGEMVIANPRWSLGEANRRPERLATRPPVATRVPFTARLARGFPYPAYPFCSLPERRGGDRANPFSSTRR